MYLSSIEHLLIRNNDFADPDFLFFYEHGYLVQDYHDDPNIAYRSCERDMKRVLGPIHSKRVALMLPRGDLDAKDPFLGKNERSAKKASPRPSSAP